MKASNQKRVFDYKVKVNVAKDPMLVFVSTTSIAEVYKRLHEMGIKNEQISEISMVISK